MTTAKPLARYSAIESALASGFARLAPSLTTTGEENTGGMSCQRGSIWLLFAGPNMPAGLVRTAGAEAPAGPIEGGPSTEAMVVQPLVSP